MSDSMQQALQKLTVEKFPYKRNLFYKLCDFIENSPLKIAYMVGPRRCGKTVLLMQLKDKYGENAVYYTFKENGSYDIIADIIHAEETKQFKIFLLDEITSLQFYDREFTNLDVLLNNCKVILTGSQGRALTKFCDDKYASAAKKYSLGFLQFNEYLEYTGKPVLSTGSLTPGVSSITELSQQISLDDFYNYLKGQYSFSDIISDCRGYIAGCLEDSIKSNFYAYNRRYSNVSEELDVEDVFKVMYAILFKMHSSINRNNLFTGPEVRAVLNDYRQEGKRVLTKEQIDNLTQSVCQDYYMQTRKLSAGAFFNALTLLYECDLIVVSSVDGSPYNSARFLRELAYGELSTLTVNTVLTEYGITFKYPLFFVTVLNDMLQRTWLNEYSIKLQDLMSTSFIGSLVECEVKGLLSSICDSNMLSMLKDPVTGHEVDFYSFSKRIAIEITVSNKNSSNVHFDEFEQCSGVDKVLLTRDVNDIYEGIRRIPYYLYIFCLGMLLY